MLALTRKALKRIPSLAEGRPGIRALADVVSTLPTQSSINSAPPALRTSSNAQPSSRDADLLAKGKIPVREDHGLYGFFRRKEDANLVGDAKYEVFEAPEHVHRLSGRSWKASELRLKSFHDLHTLWYVLLRERNVLATQREETRRMGINDPDLQISLLKVHRCRKSMARIKAVMNERRLAYEGAVKLAEKQREDHFDGLVLKHQESQLEKERKLLLRGRQRKAHVSTRRVTEAPSAQEKMGGESVNVAVVADVSPATPEGNKTTDS